MAQDAAAAGFAAVLARTEVLDGHAETAARELVAAMAFVVLSRSAATTQERGIDRGHLAALATAAVVPTTALRTAAERARGWLVRPTPLVALLTQAESPVLDTYLDLLRDAVTFAARLPPLDDAAVRAAATLAVSQDTPLPTAPAAPGPPGQGSGQASGKGSGPATPGGGGSPPGEGTTSGPGTAASTAAPASDAGTPTAPPAESLDDLYAELDALVGLATVKTEIRQQAELLRIQHLRGEAGLTDTTVTRHLVFTGNPGTGKTTVARLVARIYRAVGVLPGGQLVEVDKAGLVAGYVGQSEEKTVKVLAEAEGGVLFIDEAYSLVGDQFGQAVIDLLVKAAEDRRDRLVIILAGYTGPMAEFIAANPGLESRFRTVIEFPDYTDDELLTIFERLVEKSDYEAGPDVLAALRTIIAAQPRDESFGNARFVRNCFENAVVNHAWRLRSVAAPTREELVTLTPDDLHDPVEPAP